MSQNNIEHRLKMVLDDVKAIREFIDEHNLNEEFKMSSKHSDEGFTHLNNIEIACDLTSDECLTWNKFNHNYTNENITNK